MHLPGSRRALLVTLIVLVVIGAGVGWAWIAPDPRSSGGNGSSGLVRAEAARRDLVVGTQFPGVLGYGGSSPIPIRAAGTVTWLPGNGALADAGDILLRVDNRPVALFYGSTPAFRTMAKPAPAIDPPAEGTRPRETPPDEDAFPEAGVGGGSAPMEDASVGPDVEQLEVGLRSLGYTGFTVDEQFTSSTAEAVKRWQTSMGVKATGRVELGDVIFLPGPVRLVVDGAQLGKPAVDGVVLAQGREKVVTLQAQADDLEWASANAAVTVTLPNGQKVVGRVDAAPSSGGDAPEGQMQVTILLDREVKVGPGPVTVTYVSAERKNALAVPVLALVALAEGGYGVQLADETFVEVTPGLYSDGWVEISSAGVHAGTDILVPE